MKTRIIIIAIVVIFLLGIGVYIEKLFFPNAADGNTQSPNIQAQENINKTFSFTVTDNNGKKVTDIAYAITSADKQDQVIIKGQRASAVSGRTFFIVNLKLTNNSPQTIQLNSRDYIRISAGNTKEQYAPEMYNDPIIVQPISTEYTHVGFPIDSNQNNIILHVGELNGPKTDIPIHFK